MTIFTVGGENLIDHVTKEGSVTALPGGSPFNVAMALGRQGAETHYLTPISTDSWGDLLAQTLEKSGVTLAAERRSEPSTLARVTFIDGQPSYQFERSGTAERQISQESLDAAWPAEACALHVGSLALGDGADAMLWESFAAQKASEGVLISLDPNLRLSIISDHPAYFERLKRLFQIAHVVKLSDEDLEQLYPDVSLEEGLTRLRANCSARVLVLTRGGHGATGFVGTTRLDVPPAKIDTLVDTVGAGDTFMATLLTSLADLDALSPKGIGALTPAQLEACLRRAGAAAALNCKRAGCNPPNRAELDHALLPANQMSPPHGPAT
jgi:fructokinase